VTVFAPVFTIYRARGRAIERNRSSNCPSNIYSAYTCATCGRASPTFSRELPLTYPARGPHNAESGGSLGGSGEEGSRKKGVETGLLHLLQAKRGGAGKVRQMIRTSLSEARAGSRKRENPRAVSGMNVASAQGEKGRRGEGKRSVALPRVILVRICSRVKNTIPIRRPRPRDLIVRDLIERFIWRAGGREREVGRRKTSARVSLIEETLSFSSLTVECVIFATSDSSIVRRVFHVA